VKKWVEIKMSDNNMVRVLRSIPVLLKSKLKYNLGWTWSLALYLLIAGNGFPPIGPTVLILIAMFFVVSSVYIYNDIQDVEMDKENEVKKDRPIASGLVKSEDAKILVYLFGTIGLAVAWLVNIYSFSFIFAYFLIFFIYSHPKIKLKYRFLGKDLTLFIANPIICLAASYAISNKISVIAFQSSILAATYVFTQGPIANEASDIVEDKKYGVKSLSTMLNWRSKVQFMILGILTQIVLVPFVQLQYGVNLILPVFSIAALLLILVFTYPLLKEYDLNNYNKVFKLSSLHIFILPFPFLFISLGLPLFF
jgi:4-hydroxybenzoate polyprenyltransferase